MELRPLKLKQRAGYEAVLESASRLSQIVLALIALTAALEYGEVIFAPIILGVVIGLMFSPVARAIEKRGVPSWLAALAIMLLFIAILGMVGTALAVPLSTWIDRIPEIWESLRLQIASWRDLVGSLTGFREQLGEIMGSSGDMTVNVDDGSAVESAVYLGPTIVAELILFLASLYFFVATRDQFRIAALSLCVTRRLRFRIAHFFRDVETLVSRYLLTITVVNIGLGITVALAMWAIGMPTPLLWGALAAALNYVIYIGPAINAIILLLISLALHNNAFDILLPPAIYLAINLAESQFVTSHLLGVTLTMNPFLVFLSLAFWIWLWGPAGGFIAVPALLILYALIRNVLPRNEGLRQAV